MHEAYSEPDSSLAKENVASSNLVSRSNHSPKPSLPIVSQDIDRVNTQDDFTKRIIEANDVLLKRAGKRLREIKNVKKGEKISFFEGFVVDEEGEDKPNAPTTT